MPEEWMGGKGGTCVRVWIVKWIIRALLPGHHLSKTARGWVRTKKTPLLDKEDLNENNTQSR